MVVAIGEVDELGIVRDVPGHPAGYGRRGATGSENGRGVVVVHRARTIDVEVDDAICDHAAIVQSASSGILG